MLTIPTDSSDEETLIILEANTLIDAISMHCMMISNHLYVDMIINGKAKAGEADALLEMVKYGR